MSCNAAESVWKPELYKIQLDAPTPKALRCNPPLAVAVSASGGLPLPPDYGDTFHGELGHLEAEALLHETPDGTYLLRHSPGATDYFTLSLSFNNRTKHFRVCFNPVRGHHLLGQAKHYETAEDMVADGLISFHMQIYAAPIIQQINQQSRNCYQQSPYMTLNRRKLHALSNEMRKSIGGSQLAQESKSNAAVDGAPALGCKVQQLGPAIVGAISNEEEDCHKDAALLDDAILPSVYEKQHNFKTHTFKGLNWCEFCANFLWGFSAQGVKCDACGFVAHSKCSELVPAKCVPDLKRIRGVFGTDLTTIVQMKKCSVPFVVRRCVEEVEARGMLQEGIYRVSGFADEIEALKLALDRNGEGTDMSESAYGNVNVIAGTLKLYLRLLPVPLITFQAYPGFMAASRTPDTQELLQRMSEAARKLPLAHYDCLKYMLEHLKRVASHYAANKMNEHNLATVFAPTLIATPQHLTNLTEEIFMLSTLIAHCATIFA